MDLRQALVVARNFILSNLNPSAGSLDPISASFDQGQWSLTYDYYNQRTDEQERVDMIIDDETGTILSFIKTE